MRCRPARSFRLPEAADSDEEEVVVAPHPLRVRPIGSLLLGDEPNLRDQSLGSLGVLPDELLLQVLGCASPACLSRCERASHALRVVALNDDLWRACCLEHLAPGARLEYDPAGWRATFIRQHVQERRRAGGGDDDGSGGRSWEVSVRSRAPYFSDALYAAWHCGTATIPSHWTSYECIPRVDSSALSVEEFAEVYEARGQPVILTGLASRWAASSRWSERSLRSRYGGRLFHVGGVSMSLSNFLDYCACNVDEQPLYLFDKQFASTAPEMAGEYEVPAYFAEQRDLFAGLPAPLRPDHRWLILGGTRSGSSWHVDPNCTSAWNGVVYGTKKWVLCPPGAPPPGIDASDDGGTVTSPISLYEWFRVFYADLASRDARDAPRASRPLEATVRAGELLYVPSGWWHAALNLEPTLAITQNYAPHSSARRVSPRARALCRLAISRASSRGRDERSARSNEVAS